MLIQILREKLNPIFTSFSKSKGLDESPFYVIEEPPKNFDADFACNFAMILAKKIKTNPRKIAEEISGQITKTVSEVFSKIEIAGAGFLNLSIKDDFLFNEFKNILELHGNYGKKNINKNNKVLLEFVSANPTGPLHIGHGRGAAIGDSLSRIYAYMGYAVEKEYYLNDVGNQMNVLAASVEARFKELNGEKIQFPEDGYKGDYIINIANKIKDSKKKDCIDYKNIAVDEILNDIKVDLKDFDVYFDNWFSETALVTSKTNKKTEVESTCDWLKEKDFAYEQDGALWFASTKYKDGKDRVLRRSDGRYTYLASDVAYHKNKIQRGYSKLINLWGADHHGYVERMLAAIQALGKERETLTLILYQLVSLLRNGAPVAMSTRAGEFVTLKEVIKEVGKDACRFFFLLRAPDSPVDFDLEVAKKHSNDNPVFYVQYVHARCNSIFKTNNDSIDDWLKRKDYKEINYKLLSAKYEKDLVKKMLIFPDILETCIKSATPHYITIYLMELADQYHRFYEHCKVLGNEKELTAARLSLVAAVALITRTALSLLGVSAPERM